MDYSKITHVSELRGFEPEIRYNVVTLKKIFDMVVFKEPGRPYYYAGEYFRNINDVKAAVRNYMADGQFSRLDAIKRETNEKIDRCESGECYLTFKYSVEKSGGEKDHFIALFVDGKIVDHYSMGQWRAEVLNIEERLARQRGIEKGENIETVFVAYKAKGSPIKRAS